jgi:hypothetical protein
MNAPQQHSPATQAMLDAKKALCEGALTYAMGDVEDPKAQSALCQLADAFARARWATKTGTAGTKPSTGRGARPKTSDTVLRFSKSKGLRLAEAPSKDLHFVRDCCVESLDQPDKARFRQSNLDMIAAIDAELVYRGER